MSKKDLQGGPPPQEQRTQPGKRKPMEPKPKVSAENYIAAGRLKGKVALITGGDSGIGRSVAVHFAKEGADVAIVFLSERQDADETRRDVEKAHQRCLTIQGDLADSAFCTEAVERTVREFGRLDIVVNNAAEQHYQERFEDITDEQLQRTFATNILAHFYINRAALKHLKEGASIIHTTSVTAYRGEPFLIDYASTKGAIVGLIRSLALSLGKRKIRVNGVAPGPVWTPLIPSSFPKKKVAKFGKSSFMERPAEPDEIAPTYVFLASGDSGFYTGQVLHPNGGDIING